MNKRQAKKKKAKFFYDYKLHREQMRHYQQNGIKYKRRYGVWSAFNKKRVRQWLKATIYNVDWIDCNKELPTDTKQVQVILNTGEVSTDFILRNKWVTHCKLDTVGGYPIKWRKNAIN